uniref:Uncharacterized protein n=1 Tax=Panagrolaimus superbus TaxID=310955 RepID=A0A914Z5G7_9BILA
MIEELKEAAENRIKFGYFGYAPFAGMHLEHALTLPKTTHGSKRFLSCGITLLCTEFTEPFYLQYKWKPRRNVAEEEETPVNLELEERASSEAEVEEEIATSEFQVVVEEEEVTPSEVEVLDEEEETPTPEFQVVVDEEEVTTSDVEVIDDVKEEESATPELKVTKEETVM